MMVCINLEWMVREVFHGEVALKLSPKGWEAANYAKRKEMAFQEKETESSKALWSGKKELGVF